MNQHLQNILNTIQQDKNLSEEEKNTIIKSLKDADKEFEITNFKLDRTEKVKRTTAILLEETIEELEQKRKAVEAQNRELEIEASLERVRAVAMSMMKANDLLNICKTQFSELLQLGFTDLRNALIGIYHDEEDYFTDYDYSDFSGGNIHKIPYNKNSLVDRSVMRMKSAVDAFTEFVVEGEELEEWKAFRKENGEYDDTRIENAQVLYYYFYSISQGNIGISTFNKISEAQLIILKRFRNVFDLAYKRYVDITTAEAQTREAQIQLALERVRARTMAMQKSEELLETSLELFQQLKELGEPAEQLTIGVIKEEEGIVEVSATLKGSKLFQSFRHDISEPYVMSKMFKAWKAKEKTLVIEQHWEELREYNKIRNELVQSDMFPTDLKRGDKRLLYIAFYSKGTLALSSNEPRPKETLELLERFAKVFDQTYTRFLDLQKAEAQVREAQIEAALEKVRSKTMAMHSSRDVGETVAALFEEFGKLGIETFRCGIGIIHEERKMEVWTAKRDPNGNVNFFSGYMDMAMHPLLQGAYLDWKKKQETYVYDLKGSDLIEYFTRINNNPNYPLKYDIPSLPAGLIFSAFYFPEGFLFAFTLEKLSTEAIKIFKRFSGVFGQTYRRYLDLQKAEAQAREAQIEAALEKVRSRSLAMHESNELEEVIMVVSEQLLQLQFRFHNVSFSSTNEQRETTFWLATPGRPHPYLIQLPYINTTMLTRIFEAREKGVEFLADIITEEQNQEWLQHLVYKSRHSFSEEDKKYLLTLKGLARSTVLTKHIILAIINYAIVPYTEEQNTILKRFGNVFEQAYTRFLDLQKAETQARESQIEAALERVRSRTMAMHKSEDLHEVIKVITEQLLVLGIKFNVSNFAKVYPEGSWDLWVSSPEQSYPAFMHVPYLDHKIFNNVVEMIKKGVPAFTDIYEKEEKDSFFRHFFENTLAKYSPEERKQYVYSTRGFSRSLIATKNIWFSVCIYDTTPFSEEEIIIFKRFANVFEQAYTRFLDLQKAEAQTREAQIEASLERVRAKAMSMHRSEDLHAAVAIVFEELEKLNIGVLRCGISVLNKEKRCGKVWLTSTDGDKAVQVTGDEPFDIHPLLHGAFEAWLKQEDFYYELKGEDLVNYYKAVKTAEFMLPESQLLISDTNIKQHCFVAVYNSGGLFAFQEAAFTEEAKKIMRRFASVFDLTYKRFLDLQKAEAQAREAQIETALERVRSRTLAMQKSDELAETAAVLFQQLIALGIEPNRLYISILQDEHGKTEFWITGEDGSKVSTAYTANLNDNPTFLKMYEGWKQQRKSLVIDMHGEELETYFRHLTNLGVPFKGGLTQKRRVQDIAYFSKGFIGMASPDEQPAATLQLLERFAYVFNLTFTRFNDLQIAEAHAIQAEQDLMAIKEAKQKAEETLTELQATQKQLIQSEKMASLGELTAGIAHEIQNPLNFVNNFSEVSVELIQEMVDEVEKGNLEDAKAIADDLVQNLEKINHHGKRADAIVKGMLQHSRTTSSTKEPTDINKLADEYLRLAYHGLRAKDKSFNATLKTDFDESIGSINIIPQDIGRVLLNLITNAFYALNTPQPPKGGVAYVPTVSVSTKKVNGKIEVKVSDNGTGIPKNIVDKIFQPFFTTKPTGQGTGLGLSLAYDIVKAHGGEIKVSVKEGEYTEFIVMLPR